MMCRFQLCVLAALALCVSSAPAAVAEDTPAAVAEGPNVVDLGDDDFETVTELSNKESRITWLVYFYTKGNDPPEKEASRREMLLDATVQAVSLAKPLPRTRVAMVDVAANDLLRTRFKAKIGVEPELAMFRRGYMYRFPSDAGWKADSIVHFEECIMRPNDPNCKVRMAHKPTPPPEDAMFPVTVQELEDSSFEMALKGGSAGDWLVHFYSSKTITRMEEMLFGDVADLLRETATVGRIDIEKNPETKSRFGLRRAPVVKFFRAGMMYGFPSQATMQMDSFKHFVECVQDPDDDLCKAGILSARKVPAKRFFFDAWLDQLDEKAKRVEKYAQANMPDFMNNPTFFSIMTVGCCLVCLMLMWQETAPSRPRPPPPTPAATPIPNAETKKEK